MNDQLTKPRPSGKPAEALKILLVENVVDRQGGRHLLPTAVDYLGVEDLIRIVTSPDPVDHIGIIVAGERIPYRLVNQ